MDITKVMSAADLCNQIVHMRKVISRAKFAVKQRLGRKVKQLQRAKANEVQRKQNVQRANRLAEELKAFKLLNSDDVSKFALVNTKLLSQLIVSTKGDLVKRALYHVATHKFVEEVVNEFRQKLPNWHQEVPFILQRLGRQYHKKKEKQKLSDEVHRKLQGEHGADERNDEYMDTEQPETSSVSGSSKLDSPECFNANVKGGKLAKINENKKSKSEEVVSASYTKNIDTDTKLLEATHATSVIKSLVKQEIDKVAKKTSKSLIKKKAKAKLKTIETVLLVQQSTGYMEKRSLPFLPAPDSQRSEALIRKLDLNSEKFTDGEITHKHDETQSAAAFVSQGSIIRRRDAFFLSTNDADTEAVDDDAVNGENERNIDSIIKYGEREMEKARHRVGKGKKMRSQFTKSLKMTTYKKDRACAPLKLVGDRSEQHVNVDSFVRKKSENKTSKQRRKPELSSIGDDDDTNDKTLHPSWVAKRKQKGSSSALQCFRGKKIKFTDN